MPIDFPSTGLTANVTTYTSGSKTWIWTGYSWKAVLISPAQGIQGTTGIQGIQGTLGNQGTQGLQGGGFNQLQGATGLQGAIGLQGNTGSQGVQGTQGTLGLQGTTGTQGTIGTQGTTGSQGVQGTQGIQVQGTQGTRGLQGIYGAGIYTYGATAPGAPAIGDRWTNSDTGIEYTYLQDTNSNQWVELGAGGFIGLQGIQGTNGTVAATLPASNITGGSSGQAIVSDGTNGNWTTLTMENLPNAAFKASVTVATEANITLSGTQTIDGVAVAAGDRVLVKEQTAAQDNGIYVVSASTWSRALDANSVDAIAGGLVAVENGTTYNGQMLQTSFSLADTLGTTPMYWYPILRKNYYALDAARSLTNGTAAQSIFGIGFSCDAGTIYEFEAFVALATGTSSHNVSTTFLAGGSLTLTASSIYTTFSPSTNGGTGGADSSAFSTGTSSGGVLSTIRLNSTASTTASKGFMLRGIVRVNAAGTLTPQLTFSAAPGGTNTVAAESWITFTKLGSNTQTKIGPWA